VGFLTPHCRIRNRTVTSAYLAAINRHTFPATHYTKLLGSPTLYRDWTWIVSQIETTVPSTAKGATPQVHARRQKLFLLHLALMKTTAKRHCSKSLFVEKALWRELTRLRTRDTAKLIQRLKQYSFMFQPTAHVPIPQNHGILKNISFNPARQNSHRNSEDGLEDTLQARHSRSFSR